MRPIAILGSGPAGLLAAYAVGLTGQPVAVFGHGVRSVIGGAQFLHKPIPELTNMDPDFPITFRVEGDAEQYERKVYGPLNPPFVSFSGVVDGQQVGAWDLGGAYDRLWSVYGSSMNPTKIDADWMVANEGNFRAVISTIPAPAICHKDHHFGAATIRVAAECILNTARENTVYYDGTQHRSWYRCSRIQGHGGTEWGARLDPPMPTREITKPLGTNCDCFPEVIRVGRYGAWKKGELAHEGFYKTLKELNDRGIINIGPMQGPPVQQEML